MSLGRLIKRLRDERGWTQAELAARSGVRPALLSRLESGRQGDTQTHIIQQLAKAFGVDPAVFVRREPTRDPGELWASYW